MTEIEAHPATDNSNKKGAVPNILYVFIILFWIMCLIHLIRSRSLDDVIKYGTQVYLSLVTIATTFAILYFIRKGPRRLREIGKKDLSILVLLLVVIFPAFSVEYYAMGVTVRDFVLWLLSPSLSRNAVIVITSLTTLGFGLLLFNFRLKYRAIYGITETTVGMVVAANRVVTQVDDIVSSTFLLAVLTASIYLIVRGLDNVHQGLTKEPIDPIGTKIRTFLLKRS